MDVKSSKVDISSNSSSNSSNSNSNSGNSNSGNNGNGNSGKTSSTSNTTNAMDDSGSKASPKNKFQNFFKTDVASKNISRQLLPLPSPSNRTPSFTSPPRCGYAFENDLIPGDTSTSAPAPYNPVFSTPSGPTSSSTSSTKKSIKRRQRQGTLISIFKKSPIALIPLL